MAEEREQRNQIFTAQSPPPVVQQQQIQKAEMPSDIPIETVPLPSSGKVYPQASSLYGRESVEIKAMTAREEDILTSKALLKKGTVISELIKSCLIDKTINPADLLGGDRNSLMVAIRITGYGHEYDAEIECPECGVKSSQQFNLAELPIKRLEIEPVTPGSNAFEFKLPYCKKVVKFKFPTGRDEEDIMAAAEKQKKLGMQADTAVTTNLLYSIISLDGSEDRAKISGFVRNMPARDSLALRTYIRDNEPGIVMKQDVSCPGCGHSWESGVPIGVKFLWPGTK